VLKVRLGEIEIAYRETGSGDPVLLLNGTGESSGTWEGLTRALQDRFRCVAIDNRDVGESSYVDEPYAPADLAADTAGVIQSLKLGPCHVVGYSLGGAAAQELAIAHPELVRSLVLLSTWARSDAWFVGQMLNWQAIRRAHWEDDVAFLRALDVWLFSPATYQRPGVIEGIYAMWAAEKPQEPNGWMRQTAADIAHDVVGRVHEVPAPALVLVGTDDICTPPRYSRELCRLLPNAELVEIPDAGHCALFEWPDVVAEQIGGFLAGLG
jgi:pimeloyl-ACP methyl ester carboxylesterase